MELIGKKVRGFKFESERIDYNPNMDSYVGEIGTIHLYNRLSNSYDVIFEDNVWMYPAELIKEHLVTDKQVDTITLPLINGVPDLSEFEGVKMLVSDDEVEWYERRVLFYFSKSDCPYVTRNNSYKYAKHISVKKKITAEDIKKMFNCDDFEIV